MTTVKENDVQVGGADIVTLDFLGADFDLTEYTTDSMEKVIQLYKGLRELLITKYTNNKQRL